MTAPIEPQAALTALLARVSEFVTGLTDEQITGLLDGSLRLDLVEDIEPAITQCGICAGEGCKTCDNTGVIYP